MEVHMLPKGLVICRFCGDVRDTTGRRRSLCFCEGIACRYCGVGRTWRPISDHYDLQTGRYWHTPYFGAGIACRPCQGVAVRFGGDGVGFPGALRDDSAARYVVATVRRAGEELVETRPFEDVDARGLVALHGSSEVWEELGLEHPVVPRPLYVGTSPDGIHAGVQLKLDALLGRPVEEAWLHDRLEMGFSPITNTSVHVELLARWLPPLNAPEWPTPWNERVSTALEAFR
jgi:hypothetical protein